MSLCQHMDVRYFHQKEELETTIAANFPNRSLIYFKISFKIGLVCPLPKMIHSPYFLVHLVGFSAIPTYLLFLFITDFCEKKAHAGRVDRL